MAAERRDPAVEGPPGAHEPALPGPDAEQPLASAFAERKMAEAAERLRPIMDELGGFERPLAELNRWADDFADHTPGVRVRTWLDHRGGNRITTMLVGDFDEHGNLPEGYQLVEIVGGNHGDEAVGVDEARATTVTGSRCVETLCEHKVGLAVTLCTDTETYELNEGRSTSTLLGHEVDHYSRWAGTCDNEHGFDDLLATHGVEVQKALMDEFAGRTRIRVSLHGGWTDMYLSASRDYDEISELFIQVLLDYDASIEPFFDDGLDCEEKALGVQTIPRPSSFFGRSSSRYLEERSPDALAIMLESLNPWKTNWSRVEEKERHLIRAERKIFNTVRTMVADSGRFNDIPLNSLPSEVGDDDRVLNLLNAAEKGLSQGAEGFAPTPAFSLGLDSTSTLTRNPAHPALDIASRMPYLIRKAAVMARGHEILGVPVYLESIRDCAADLDRLQLFERVDIEPRVALGLEVIAALVRKEIPGLDLLAGLPRSPH